MYLVFIFEYLSKILIESYVFLGNPHCLHCHHAQHDHQQECYHCYSLCILCPSRKHCPVSSIVEQILFNFHSLLSLTLNGDSIVRLQSHMHIVGIIVGRSWISDSHLVLIIISMCPCFFEPCHRHSVFEEVLFGEVFRQLNVKHFILGQGMQTVVIHEKPFRQNFLDDHLTLTRVYFLIIFYRQLQSYIDSLTGPFASQLPQSYGPLT